MGYERQNFLNKQKLYAEQLNHMEDGIVSNEALIEALSAFVNDILDSDDETLNELSEIVASIKDNKTTINAILNDKVNVADIVNTLTSDATSKPLSAAQGKYLNTLITALQTAVNGKAPTNHKSTATTYGTGDGTNYGHVKLSNATNSTSGVSEGVAATPAAVKAAYDLANTALTTAADREPSGAAAQLMNRTTAVNAADTNYTTLMARGVSLHTADTNPSVNGAIAWTYK